MPRGDRTGPNGMGPMSGRAAGFCGRFDMPGYANRGFGRGFGTGAGRMDKTGGGRARGWRHTFWATGLPGWMRSATYFGPRQGRDATIEKESLKYQEGILQSQLDFVRKRLHEFNASDSAEK